MTAIPITDIETPSDKDLCLFLSKYSAWLMGSERMFEHNLYLCIFNGFTCGAILLCMVVVGTLPFFIFKKQAFTSIR